MKKLFGIVVLCLLWCNAGNAGNAGPAEINEPGQDKKCAKKSIKKIFKKEVLKVVSEGSVTFFYFSCDPIGKYDEWAYAHTNWDYSPNLDLQDLHDTSYGECMKNADIYTKQDCFLYSIDDVIVWGKDAAFVRKLEKEVYKKIAIKKKEVEAKEKQAMEEAIANPRKEKSVGSTVSYKDSGFVNFKDQDKLKYSNPKDDIAGRSLSNRGDVNDDYQIHNIYILAKDSEDKQFDVNGKIEKIISKAQEDLQKKIGKKLKYDMTKEGKIDISFLRVDKTAEEIDYLEPHPVHYFFIQIARNGFYHPKKIYNVFYQEDFYQKDMKRRPGGASMTSTFETPKGDIFMPLSVIFMKRAMKQKVEALRKPLFLNLFFHSICNQICNFLKHFF